MLTKKDLKFHFLAMSFMSFVGIGPFSFNRRTGQASVKSNKVWPKFILICLQVIQLGYMFFGVSRVMYYTWVHPVWRPVETPSV